LFKLFIISSLRNPFIVVQSHTLLTVLIRRISSPILVLLVELCKSLKELLSLSFLDCGCKGKDFFLTSKFFDEKFSSFFFSSRSPGGWKLSLGPANLIPYPRIPPRFHHF